VADFLIQFHGHGRRRITGETIDAHTVHWRRLAHVLAAGAVYSFILSHQEKKEATGFDPTGRATIDLKRRLKPEPVFLSCREKATMTASPNEFLTTIVSAFRPMSSPRTPLYFARQI